MAGRGLGRGADAESESDGVQEGRQFPEDEVGGEAKDFDPAAAEEGGPAPVVGPREREEVLAAVEFHGQMPSGTVEVEDVRAAGVLPPKLETREAFGAQVSPESGFSVGAAMAQGTATNE